MNITKRESDRYGNYIKTCAVKIGSLNRLMVDFLLTLPKGTIETENETITLLKNNTGISFFYDPDTTDVKILLN